MKKFFFVGFLLTGCAAERMQTVADSWVDQPASELIKEWGIPDKEMTMDGTKIYEYNRCDGAYHVPIGNRIVSKKKCERWTFHTKGGNIKEVTFDKK